MLSKLRELRDANCQESNEQLCKDFLKDLRVAGRSEATIRSYSCFVRDFLDFICGLNVTQVTHREVREWLHHIDSRGCASLTLSCNKYALGSFFRYLQVIGLIQSSPTRLIPNRKIRRRIPKFHSVEEMELLLKACETLRDRAIFSTLWASGCRRAELLGMKVEHVDWRERTIRVIGKGDKERLVPLTTKAANALREYIFERKNGPIFLSADIVQDGGLMLVRGVWLAHWRENRRLPDGSVERVRRTKKIGSVKEIPTKDQAREAMRAILRAMPDEWLRCSKAEDLRPLGARALDQIIKKVCLRAGIEATHPHAFRHTFATHMLEGGADLITVGGLLGHVSANSTQIYLHPSARFMRDTLKRCHPGWGKDGD